MILIMHDRLNLLLQISCPPDYRSWLQTQYVLFGSKWSRVFSGPMWSLEPIMQAGNMSEAVKRVGIPVKVCNWVSAASPPSRTAGKFSDVTAVSPNTKYLFTHRHAQDSVRLDRLPTMLCIHVVMLHMCTNIICFFTYM